MITSGTHFSRGLPLLSGGSSSSPVVLAAATVALGFAGYFFALTGVPLLVSASILIVSPDDHHSRSG